MAADEEAAIAAIIAATILLDNEREESMETVLDLPNVLAVLLILEDAFLVKGHIAQLDFARIYLLCCRR